MPHGFLVYGSYAELEVVVLFEPELYRPRPSTMDITAFPLGPRQVLSPRQRSIAYIRNKNVIIVTIRIAMVKMPSQIKKFWVARHSSSQFLDLMTYQSVLTNELNKLKFTKFWSRIEPNFALLWTISVALVENLKASPRLSPICWCNMNWRIPGWPSEANILLNNVLLSDSGVGAPLLEILDLPLTCIFPSLLTWYHVVCVVSIRAAFGVVLCNLGNIRVPVLQWQKYSEEVNITLHYGT